MTKRDQPVEDNDSETRVFAQDHLKVYELVVVSGFVASSDIANLCLSSKVIYKQTKDLALWKSVCCEKWPCTKELLDKFPLFKGAVQKNGYF